jgi:hypothetical protein
MVLVSTKPNNHISILQTKFSDREGDHVADLHFTRMCAMLLTASEGEHHGTHPRAVSPLSQRPGHQRR